MTSLIQVAPQDPDREIFVSEELVERWRGAVTLATLANHRTAGVGPPYLKLSKAILYPLDLLEKWEQQNLVLHRTDKVAKSPDAA